MLRSDVLPVKLREATAGDLPAVLALLDAHHLPTAGIDAPLEGFLVAEEGGAVVGVIGMEMYDAYGLLRSAAVDESRRGSGVGRLLVERLLADAGDRGVKSVYLLTTTAEQWFPRFGFEKVARDTVPEPVGRSVEFAEACPASATVMMRRVTT
jgi:amino-acid N-acetyltransferase